MGVLTKCTVIPLSYVDTDELPFKEFCKEFFEIQSGIRGVNNKISTDFWLRKMQDLQVKEETGAWPRFNATAWGNEEYHRYKAALPTYNTANLSQLIRTTVNQLTAHYKDALSGKRSIDSFKGDQPLVVHNQNLRIEYVEGGCELVVGLFSNEIKQKYSTKNGQVRFRMYLKSGSLKAIAERCADGEYKVGASTVNYNRKKRQFELALTYSFVQDGEAALDPEKVLGVDLGVSNAYYAATNFSFDRFSEPGGDIEAFRKKVEGMRWKLRKQRAVCGDGSIGHGYKTRMRPVTDLADMIARFRDNKNHLMSRKIVDEAVRLGCGVIQMEDLTGISTDSVFLKNWSYYDLQMKIKSKAAEKGVAVKIVEPAYTSQRCSKCGYISNENRPKTPSWSAFRCVKCGYETNADYNAARNIATPGIAEIIKKTKCEPEAVEETA